MSVARCSERRKKWSRGELKLERGRLDGRPAGRAMTPFARADAGPPHGPRASPRLNTVTSRPARPACVSQGGDSEAAAPHREHFAGTIRALPIPKARGEWSTVVVSSATQKHRLRRWLPILAHAERRLAEQWGLPIRTTADPGSGTGSPRRRGGRRWFRRVRGRPACGLGAGLCRKRGR